ncbi:hypothetical protein BKE38_21335 [Pseudoroseomonas deserti]|uniref:Uncharacterized protein n=1 Tax=Teichococcus deserti TaxID=1817963 RepID=A0A1V2GXA2_9PROT|nr:hypothetical protein [Pseudoroseomonas deserti]ONG48978.1 hypothetical protein BKE38_21335 [Pseudoroseomonas deserti]
MSDLTTVNRYDPVTGELRSSYVTDMDEWGFGRIYSRTTYDVDQAHAWRSYTINTDYWGEGTSTTSSIVAVMDDGGTMTTAYSYWGALANHPTRFLEKWTRTDAEGHVVLVVENWEERTGRYDTSDISKKIKLYEPGSADPYYVATQYFDGRDESITSDKGNGNKDYVLNTWSDGRLKAEDYNPETGLLDYVITRDDTGYRLVEDYDAQGRLAYAIETLADGRQVARDHDPATGLPDYVITADAQGGQLLEDYDAAGRLDYVIQRWADGRMVATDYDLTGSHPWDVYTITYNAAGQIESAIGV